MNKTRMKKRQRARRHRRVRGKVHGTAERPRLCVFRSSRHIYTQVIDDDRGETIAAVSTRSPAIRDDVEHGGSMDAAEQVGRAIAERCLEKDIEQVSFDRGGYKYHGRIAALADAAREAGLDF